MAEQKKGNGDGLLETYTFNAGDIPVVIKITRSPSDYVPEYQISIPLLAEGTKLMLNALKADLITQVKLDVAELIDPKLAAEVKKKFEQKASELLSRQFVGVAADKKPVLISYLMQSTLGLGELEILLADENLEDIAINGPNEPIQVYHKRHGWCKTNLWIKKDDTIYEYAAMVGRKSGRQINVLNPIMNTYLPSGDRINATLTPISSAGNTISIRKFAKNPWTMSFLIHEKTISPEVAAWVWLCVQNEISLVCGGGAAAGKTSLLNAVACMIPPNQRIISLEDTRELSLPEYLHWIPMLTREANPEGKGEISLLELLVNSLRQRPDRLIVGEIRRQREAEVLFEAMHTGHSVYATMHADNAQEAVIRLTTPPINLPKTMLPSLGGIITQYRNRRTGLRRTLEFAEITDSGDANVIYRWDPRTDELKEVGKPTRLAETLALYTGMTTKEMNEDLADKAKILRWMVERQYFGIDIVGKISADYCLKPEEVLDAAKKNKAWI